MNSIQLLKFSNEFVAFFAKKEKRKEITLDFDTSSWANSRWIWTYHARDKT